MQKNDRTINIAFVPRLSPLPHEPCTKSVLQIIRFKKTQTRTSNMRGKRKQGDQVKGGFVSAVGVWMEVQGHVPRGGGTEAKETEE